MRHYLDRLQESMIAKWNTEALSDYRGEDFTFANFATEIARIHTIFNVLDVKRGDKVALAAKNCSRWAMAFLATTTHRAVAVPILCDFTPEAITNLTAHSDSFVLFTEPKIWDEMEVEKMPQLRIAINVENYSILYLKDEEKRSEIETKLADIPAVYPEEMRHKVFATSEFHCKIAFVLCNILNLIFSRFLNIRFAEINLRYSYIDCVS